METAGIVEETTPSANVPKLTDSQLRDFDIEYVTPEMWERTESWFSQAFPEGEFSFLDVGGGNGRFTDSLLERFPKARGVLIDNGAPLLLANKTHPRKTVICESATNLERRFEGQEFDLICFNWLLHHLVLRSYDATCRLQLQTIAAARNLLSSRGKICVFEDLYEGIFLDTLPSRIIYQLTSSRILSPLIKRMGANTAGCGVCFHSLSQWDEFFREGKLAIEQFHTYEKWPVSQLRRIALHLGSARIGQYLLAPKQSPETALGAGTRSSSRARGSQPDEPRAARTLAR